MPAAVALPWPLVVIDFEASALDQDSYPVEVGLARWGGPDTPILGWSALIAPTVGGMRKGRRSAKSARLHGINRALARLEAGLRERGGELFLCTQNIDDLHERAGSRAVIHMHGELLKARCMACGAIHPWVGDMGPADACPACHRIDALRPHVVWFGEVPLAMDHIAASLGRADLFAAIGTSGTVAPASAFAARARQAGIPTLELNLEASSASAFDERRFGPAGETVPRWVDDTLREIDRA